MADDDELTALRERVAQLEAARRRRFPWAKAIGFIVVGVFVLLVIAQAFGPKTYADIANEDAEACIRSGNDGRWYPGDGNLQDICRIRGDVKALQRQGIDAAQPR